MGSILLTVTHYSDGEGFSCMVIFWKFVDTDPYNGGGLFG